MVCEGGRVKWGCEGERWECEDERWECEGGKEG